MDTMDTTPPTLGVALLVGSVRTGRVADALLPWLRRRLRDQAWMTLDVVDLAGFELAPAMDRGSPVGHRLDQADAFVVLTPEYNHSFPASLKLALDSHLEEWARKPFAFVAYGAGSGGVRAVEQLRQVVPELRGMSTRNAVHVVAPWEHVDDTGAFRASPAVDAALDATLEELRWWADALAAARRGERLAASA